jgi:putative intracellular protease/amidase
VAVLAAHGVDEAELTGAIRALRSRGALVRVVAPTADPVRTVRTEGELGATCQPDEVLDDATASEAVTRYDALVLPGAVVEPGEEKLSAAGTRFVHEFTVSGKPVALVSDGPWTPVVLDALVEPLTSGTSADRMLVVDRRPVNVDPGPGLAEFCELTIKVLSSTHEPDAVRADPHAEGPRGRQAPIDSDREFLRLVAQRAGLTTCAETERLVRAVFGVLAERLDQPTADALAARLPSGLRHVVRSAVSIPFPTQRSTRSEAQRSARAEARRAHASSYPLECGPGTTGMSWAPGAPR